MPPITFTIEVEDDGTVVVNKFTKNVEDSAKKAGKSAGRMTKAFTGVRKGIGGVSKAVFSLRGLLIGLGASAVIRSVLRASFAQEEAVTRVNAALRASGQFSDEASKSLQNFASQMQATTIFGDEVILNQIALAQAFGFTTENVQEAVAAAVELSAAAGIQLEEAVRRLGRSISGSVEDIAKFAPAIRNLTKEQLAAGDAAKVLGNALRGQAAAQAETARGRFIQLGNALGDVVEKIGDSIISSDRLQQALKDLAEGINEANAAAGDDKGKLGDVLSEFVPKAETVTTGAFLLEKGARTLALGINTLSFTVDAVGDSFLGTVAKIEETGASLFGFNIVADIAANRQEVLGTEIREGALDIARQVRALFGLTTAHKNAAAAADKQAEAQKDLGEAASEASKKIQEAEKSNKAFVQGIADLGKITPEAAIGVITTFNELDRRVKALPDSFSKTRDELSALLLQPPGFLPTQEMNALVSADLDMLTARFGQLPTDIGNPLQQASVKILDFLGLTRLTAEEATTAINGFVSSFSTAFAFSTSEAASQFGQLSSEFQAGFATLNALTAKAAAFETQSAIDKAAIIIGIASSLIGNLSTLAGEGGRSQFEAFKALAIGEAVIAAALGIARALGEGGPFLGPLLAVSIAAQTAVQIQKIKSTQFQGGGTSAPSAGGALSIAAAGAATGAEVVPAGATTDAGAVSPAAPVAGDLPVVPTQITISVSGFIGDEAELASALGEIISEAEGDDVEFQLS